MSATHRSLIRLPDEIFTNLIHREVDPSSSSSISLLITPQGLKDAICSKLQDYNGSGGSIGEKNTNGSGITTVGQLMRLSPITLLRVLDPLLINDECQELMKRISRQCSSKPKTAKEMLHDLIPISSEQRSLSLKQQQQQQQQHYIPTGIPRLDTILRGGIRINSITEIVGCAGIGKTQLVMQIAIIAAAKGMGCIYIDTEKKLSLKRMYEIAKERYDHFENKNVDSDNSISSSNDNNDEEIHDRHDHYHHQRTTIGYIPFKQPLQVMNNITIHTPNSTSELQYILSRLQEEIILRNMHTDNNSNFPVKLVILDSIAAPTRRDFGGEDARERVNAIFRIAQMLKQIADETNVAILVINQIIEKVVVTKTDFNSSRRHSRSGYDPRQQQLGNQKQHLSTVKAALGTSWYHCVSTRIQLEHALSEKRGSNNDNNDLDDNNMVMLNHLRKATVVKSNLVGRGSTNFEITLMGVCQV